MRDEGESLAHIVKGMVWEWEAWGSGGGAVSTQMQVSWENR